MTKKQNKKKAQRAIVRVPRPLDPPAMAYANLLRDPCNAPLAYPIYDGTGGSGGMLLRYETQTTVTTAAGQDIVFCCVPALLRESSQPAGWVPNVVDNTDSLMSVFQLSMNGATLKYEAYQDPNYMPGAGMLGAGNGDAWRFRPVAACMSVTYTGTELDRGGLLASAVSHDYRQFLYEGNGATQAVVDQYKVLAPVQQRTPDGTVEVNFTPGAADRRYRFAKEAVGVDNHGGMYIMASGFKAGVTLLRRVVIVYEALPDAGSGLGMPANTVPPKSRNTNNDVLRYLGDAAAWAFRNRREIAAVGSVLMGQRAQRRIEL